MIAVPFAPGFDRATLAACAIALAASVSAIALIWSRGRLEDGFLMALASLPYMVAVPALSIADSRRMHPRWSSFLISSGISRKTMIWSFYARSVAVLLAISLSLAAVSALTREDLFECASLAMLLSVASTSVGTLWYSTSGSSLASDVLGVSVPMALAVVSYMCFADGLRMGWNGALACLLASAAVVASCAWLSARGFRRLDL